MKNSRQYRTYSRFLLVSLAIHGALLSWMYVKLPQKKDNPAVPVSIEFRQMPAGVAQGSSGQISKSRNSRNQTEKKYFGATFSRLAEVAKTSITSGDTFLHDRKRDNPNAPWGQGAETFERIEDYTLFKTLFSRIDSSLSYPAVLARNKIQGTVNARFVLNKKGECDWKYTQILGKEPYLQLYVLDLLKRVCSENFKRYVRDRELTNVDMSFQFAISENGDKQYEKERQILVGNTMAFFRNNHQSILEWELGPFRGMFPVPAVYLNMPWIIENWERLVHNKDPIKEFKKEFG